MESKVDNEYYYKGFQLGKITSKTFTDLGNEIEEKNGTLARADFEKGFFANFGNFNTNGFDDGRINIPKRNK